MQSDTHSDQIVQQAHASPHHAKCIENGKFMGKIILLIFFLISYVWLTVIYARWCHHHSHLHTLNANLSLGVWHIASNAPILLLSLLRPWFMHFNFLLCLQCRPFWSSSVRRNRNSRNALNDSPKRIWRVFEAKYFPCSKCGIRSETRYIRHNSTGNLR